MAPSLSSTDAGGSRRSGRTWLVVAVAVAMVTMTVPAGAGTVLAPSADVSGPPVEDEAGRIGEALSVQSDLGFEHGDADHEAEPTLAVEAPPAREDAPGLSYGPGLSSAGGYEHVKPPIADRVFEDPRSAAPNHHRIEEPTSALGPSALSQPAAYLGAPVALTLFPVVYVASEDNLDREGPNVFSSIRDGVDHVLPGGTVYIAPGTYEGVTVVDTKPGIRLHALGPGEDEVDEAGPSEVLITESIRVQAADVTVDGITIDRSLGPGVSTQLPHVHLSGSGASLLDSTIIGREDNRGIRDDGVHVLAEDVRLAGNHIQGALQAIQIDADGQPGLEIVNNTVTQNGVGVTAYPSEQVTGAETGAYIANNTITENTGWLSEGAGLVIHEGFHAIIENNRISHNLAGGMQLKFADGDLIVQNNTFWDNQGFGAKLSYASATTLENNRFRGNEGNLHIYGPPGTEPASIDRSNTVEGRPVCFLVDVSNVELGPEDDCGFVYVSRSANVAIHDVRLAPNNAVGVHLVNTTNARVENVTIPHSRVGVELLNSQHNTIVDSSLTGRADPDDGDSLGIWMTAYTGYTYSDENTIQNNEIEAFTFGISRFAGDENEIVANTLEDNAYHLYGVAPDNEWARSNTVDGRSVCVFENIEDTEITPEDGCGTLAVFHSENVTVRDLELANNQDGIRFFDTHNSRIENVTLRNHTTGIQLVASEDNTVVDNRIEDTQPPQSFLAFGIHLHESSGNTVDGNTVVDTVNANTYPDHDMELSELAYLPDGALYNYGGSDNLIRDNTLRNGPDAGFLINGLRNVLSDATVIQNNTVETHSRVTGILNGDTDNAVIVNNTVRTAAHGLVQDSSGDGTIANNTLAGNTFGMVLLGRDNRVVDNTMRDNRDGMVMCPCENTITESNTVDGKPVLFYQDASDLVIEDVEPGYLGILDAWDITVRNVTLTGSGHGPLLANVDDVAVENLTVQDSWMGAWVHEASNVEIRDSSFANTQVEAVSLDGTTESRVIDTTVTRAGLGDNLGPGGSRTVQDVGILDLRGASNRVQNSTVDQSPFGILAYETSGTVLEDNLAQDNELAGITAQDPDDVQIRGNEVQANGNGVLVTSPSLYNYVTFGSPGWWANTLPCYAGNVGVMRPCAAASEAVGTLEPGSAVSSDLKVWIEDNLVEDNDEAGIHVALLYAESYNIHVHHNLVAGNGDYGLDFSFSGSGVLDARDNYWGAPDGPSSPDPEEPVEDPWTGELADGAGDAVSEDPNADGKSNVRFDPWLQAPPGASS